MKKTVVFLIVWMVCSTSHGFAEELNGITYAWEERFDAETLGKISVESVYECYRHVPAGELGLDESLDLKSWLTEWTDKFF